MSSLTITQNRFEQAEFVRAIHFATPDEGTTPEDVLKPEYWAHVASQLRPGSRIEVVPEDGAWFGEYYVAASSRNWAKVVPLRVVELASKIETPILEGAKHAITWGGQLQKYRIVRLSDKTVIKQGFATKAEAEKGLADYELALAA